MTDEQRKRIESEAKELFQRTSMLGSQRAKKLTARELNDLASKAAREVQKMIFDDQATSSSRRTS